MVFVEPYIQPRILKVILANGGEATSREISKRANLKMISVFMSGRQLQRYGFVKKKVIIISEPTSIGTNIPRRLSVYSLNEKNMRNIMMKINKMPEGWTR